VASVLQVRRFDAANDAVPAMEKQDFHDYSFAKPTNTTM
jgi:hypothetical protein